MGFIGMRRGFASPGAAALATLLLGLTLLGRDASADIEGRPLVRRSSLARPLEVLCDLSDDRYAVIHGEVVRTRVGRSDLGPGALLDRLERRALEALPSSRVSDPRGELARLLRRPYRVQHPGFGVLVQLFDTDPSSATSALLDTLEGARLGAAGGGGLVILASGDDSGPSEVYVTFFDDDLALARYLGLRSPQATSAGPVADRPGEDVPGLTRFPGSQRVISISELSDADRVHQVSYVGAGSTDAHLDHYRGELEALGLELRPARRGPHGGQLLARGNGREIHVLTTRDPAGRGVVDVIQVRSREERER